MNKEGLKELQKAFSGLKWTQVTADTIKRMDQEDPNNPSTNFVDIETLEEPGTVYSALSKLGMPAK